MRYSWRKKFQWFCFILFVLIPLLFSVTIIENLRLTDLIYKGDICNKITFYYDKDRTIKTYNNNSLTAYNYVLLPSFTDMNEIGVETSMDRVIFSASDHLVSVEKGKPIKCQFQTDIPYETSFLNKKGKILATDTIIFLKSDKLPTLYIDTETGTMEKLNTDKSYSETGSYELVDANGNILFSSNLNNISARGNQTFLYEKKSYQIDLSQPQNILGMGESDTWILLCNVYDPSYIRNKLTYDMAVHAGMEGSPKSEYIDVYFNDSYAGMYLLAEKVEFAPNRLEYNDLESKNLSVNGNNLNKNRAYISKDKKQNALYLLRNPSDITGAYLIEHDYGYKFEEITSGFITNMGEKFVLKNPEHASVEEITYISNVMQEIEDAIMAPDGINPTTGKHYSEYIDLDSWVDKYLVEEICRNNGGGATSSYFYKPCDSVSTKVYGGPVWDYDKAYGNYYSYNHNTRDLGFLTLHNHYTNWFYYLYQHADFRDVVKQNYKEKFSNYISTMASNRIDEYTSLINASAKLDNARFANIYIDHSSGALDYRELSESIRQFILKRKEFLDQVWIEDAEIVLVHFLFESENGNRTVGIIKGETLQDFPHDVLSNRTISHWENEKNGDIFTVNTPITEEVTLIPIYKEE